MEMSVSDEYPEVTFLLRHWSNGGSALPAVKKLAACGYSDDAAAVARLALRAPDCADREGWKQQSRRGRERIRRLGDSDRGLRESSSEERWDELMRFVPVEEHYQRLPTLSPFSSPFIAMATFSFNAPRSSE